MKKERIIRYFLVGLVFLFGFTCLGIYFQIHHWSRYVFFLLGHFTILYPALEYWNEALKK